MRVQTVSRYGRWRRTLFRLRSRYRPAVVDHRQRRRRRALLLKALWFLWLGGGGIYFLWIGSEGLVHSSLFEIRRVEIGGLQRLSYQDLVPLIGVGPSTGLFEVDLTALKERLLVHPWIKEVQIRKNYPDTLAIQVHERVPAAVVEKDSGGVLIDDMGMELGPVGEFLSDPPGAEAWPVLKGIDLAALRGGDPDAQSAFRKAMVLRLLVNPGADDSKRPLRIDVGDPEEVVVEREGYRILFGGEDFSKRWEQYRLVEPDIAKRKGRIQEVDLRFPGQVIIR